MHRNNIYLKFDTLSLLATVCNKRVKYIRRIVMLSDHSDYLTPYDVADELGLSLTTVYNLLRAKKIPGSKIGKSWRIPKDALEEVIYG